MTPNLPSSGRPKGRVSPFAPPLMSYVMPRYILVRIRSFASRLMVHRLTLGLLLAIGACLQWSTLATAVEGGRDPVAPSASQATLLNPIGITTAGPVFTPLIPAGRKLPVVYSQTFGNQTNGRSEVLVELSQKSAAGVETIASLRIKIPPAKNQSLNVIVTLSISNTKRMTIKTTVVETASTQQFGPFMVE